VVSGGLWCRKFWAADIPLALQPYWEIRASVVGWVGSVTFKAGVQNRKAAVTALNDFEWMHAIQLALGGFAPVFVQSLVQDAIQGENSSGTKKNNSLNGTPLNHSGPPFMNTEQALS